MSLERGCFFAVVVAVAVVVVVVVVVVVAEMSFCLERFDSSSKFSLDLVVASLTFLPVFVTGGFDLVIELRDMFSMTGLVRSLVVALAVCAEVFLFLAEEEDDDDDDDDDEEEDKCEAAG